VLLGPFVNVQFVVQAIKAFRLITPIRRSSDPLHNLGRIGRQWKLSRRLAEVPKAIP
jgi:hypothetical protein